jgi:hypothetical protein
MIIPTTLGKQTIQFTLGVPNSLEDDGTSPNKELIFLLNHQTSYCQSTNLENIGVTRKSYAMNNVLMEVTKCSNK